MLWSSVIYLFVDYRRSVRYYSEISCVFFKLQTIYWVEPRLDSNQHHGFNIPKAIKLLCTSFRQDIFFAYVLYHWATWLHIKTTLQDALFGWIRTSIWLIRSQLSYPFLYKSKFAVGIFRCWLTLFIQDTFKTRFELISPFIQRYSTIKLHRLIMAATD